MAFRRPELEFQARSLFGENGNDAILEKGSDMKEKKRQKDLGKGTRTRLQGQQAKPKHRNNEKREEGTYMEEREKISKYAG